LTLKRLRRYARRKLIDVAGIEVNRVPSTRPTERYPLGKHYLRRLLYFEDLLRQIEHVAGDVVECGVGNGYSLYLLASLTGIIGPERKIWGFDSFQGLPAPTEEDEARDHAAFVYEGRFKASREWVIRQLLFHGLSPEDLALRVTLVEGWFADTLEEYRGEGIAFLHIDADLYSSYKECLAQHRNWVGPTKAIDGFFADSSVRVVKHPLFRYYVVKP